jgi:hypothetical protein
MKRLAMAMGIIAMGVTGAMADDLFQFQPDWRGDPGTTYQRWEFDTSANPASPDVYASNCGTSIGVAQTVMTDANWYNIGMDTQGYWRLTDFLTTGTMELEIPNCPTPDPYKEVWAQIRYVDSQWGHKAPIVSLTAGGTVIDQSVGERSEVHFISTADGSWYVEQYKWRLEPNPSVETIHIQAQPGEAALIDQIVVDTICVPPDPNTLTVRSVDLGGGLTQWTLTYTPDPDCQVAGADAENFGNHITGPLNQVYAFGTEATPTLDLVDYLGSAEADADTHWLVYDDQILAAGEPGEDGPGTGSYLDGMFAIDVEDRPAVGESMDLLQIVSAGTVNYQIEVSQWNPGTSTATSTTFTGTLPIPEPATCSLLALGGLGLVRRRRR